jgi:hypothetical protein
MPLSRAAQNRYRCRSNGGRWNCSLETGKEGTPCTLGRRIDDNRPHLPNVAKLLARRRRGRSTEARHLRVETECLTDETGIRSNQVRSRAKVEAQQLRQRADELEGKVANIGSLARESEENTDTEEPTKKIADDGCKVLPNYS